jgi:hypothetical protein
MIIEYKEHLNRGEMAAFVSGCMGDCYRDFEPYKPMAHDDTFWTVDRGNDWKVKFFPDRPNEMEIMHRYRDADGVRKLCEWVAHRSGGKVVV